MAFAPAPEPVSPLGRYRILSPNAGVRVSPLCLGAMNIGTAWEKMMGAVPKEESFKLLDYFYEQGGNFIDVKFLLNSMRLTYCRLPMCIKMKRVNFGSVNGWQNEATDMRLFSPLNLLHLIRLPGRIIQSMPISPATQQRVCTSPLKTV